MQLSISRSKAADAGSFLLLMIFLDLMFAGLTRPELISAEVLATIFYVALFIDIIVSLYAGTFGALRTATWLLLIGAGAGLQIFGLGILNWILLQDLRAAS